jgi:acyl-CoA synthetase (AMP-forming)/AMP-acid ligase II
MAAHVETLTGRLAAAGVRRGDRVALALGNSAEFIQLVIAVNALGAAVAPLNPAYTSDEFGFYLTDIAPRLLLLPASLPPAERAALATRTPTIRVLQASEGPPELSTEDGTISPIAPTDASTPEDVAIVLHTSGTTSRPKQVALLQRNLMASARTIAEHYKLEKSDISFCVMPLFHVHGLVASVCSALSAGGSVVVPRRFTPNRFWPQARKAGATWVSAGPTLHHMILDKVDQDGPPATLRFTRSCSSALAPALMARAEETYAVPMLEAYGMTEATHQMTSNPLPPAARYSGSVGTPTGTEVAVVGQDRRFLADGYSGEVVIRGPGVTKGYVNNPEANATSFFDGWFRTGDQGVFRNGYLYLEGRLKEMIIRGGENISPAEIEAVLLEHPSVAEAACFGVEDDKYGELPAAAVTLKADVDTHALIAHCRERLAPYKVPLRIHVLEEIPRTPTGKVQRRRVAAFVAGTPSPP